MDRIYKAKDIKDFLNQVYDWKWDYEIRDLYTGIIRPIRSEDLDSTNDFDLVLKRKDSDRFFIKRVVINNKFFTVCYKTDNGVLGSDTSKSEKWQKIMKERHSFENETSNREDPLTDKDWSVLIDELLKGNKYINFEDLLNDIVKNVNNQKNI